MQLCILHCLSFFENVLDRTAVEERHFRNIIHFAVQDHLEALDSFLDRNVLTRDACEVFSYVERLRQELLDLSCTVYDLLILFLEFLHTEDRDDILQFSVTLERFLNSSCYFIVLFTYNFSFQDT